jgi:hypothetical protein
MAEKPKKPQKLKARLPRGLEDRGPAAILTSLGTVPLTGKYLVMKYPDRFSQEAVRAARKRMAQVAGR